MCYYQPLVCGTAQTFLLMSLYCSTLPTEYFIAQTLCHIYGGTDIRLQNSRFRKAGSAVSVILECEALEPHTPAGRVRRENDCRLSIQRIRSKEGLYNVTEVTEIVWQVHPHLKFDTLDAFFSREICCVSVQWWFIERTSVSVFL